MNYQELFYILLVAIVVGNIVNRVVVNPLIIKIQNAIFGGNYNEFKNISGSAKSKSKS